jgi:hypothetical protein
MVDEVGQERLKKRVENRKTAQTKYNAASYKFLFSVWKHPNSSKFSSRLIFLQSFQPFPIRVPK